MQNRNKEVDTRNSQFNTKWTNNPSLKQTKKVTADSELAPGWYNGRVVNWNTHYTQRKCLACGKIGCPSYQSKYCSKQCADSLRKGKTGPRSSSACEVETRELCASRIVAMSFCEPRS